MYTTTKEKTLKTHMPPNSSLLSNTIQSTPPQNRWTHQNPHASLTTPSSPSHYMYTTTKERLTKTHMPLLTTPPLNTMQVHHHKTDRLTKTHMPLLTIPPLPHTTCTPPQKTDRLTKTHMPLLTTPSSQHNTNYHHKTFDGLTQNPHASLTTPSSPSHYMYTTTKTKDSPKPTCLS
ncbi:unnamed protein product [Mytilus edulis]|uniref:Uncharacterized protein n=1 Tax=Mytilus edulis TaxID=6550 RepID=A0A8S3QMR1_MYTED|nr:unnamed protein product [Mytilus edulis]